METYTAAVRIGNVWGEWFATNRGTRKGDPISPNTFILVLERILDKIRDKEGGVKIGGTRINNLTFADDIDLIEEDAQRLEETIRALNEEGKRYGFNVNFENTKKDGIRRKRTNREIVNRRRKRSNREIVN